MRFGPVVGAAILLAGCGGDDGIKTSGPIVSLTRTEACLAAEGPDADPGDETCYRIEPSSKLEPGLSEGDLVTIRASDGVVVELTKIGAPE